MKNSNISIIDCLETPEKYIPEGLYCYHNDYVCPFWDSNPGMYPKREDGYCHFLDKSDWDLNEMRENTTKIVKTQNKEILGKTVKEAFGNDFEIDPISGKKCHTIMSLLWDQCKECRINMGDPEDTEYITISNDEIQNILKKGK